ADHARRQLDAELRVLQLEVRAVLDEAVRRDVVVPGIRHARLPVARALAVPAIQVRALEVLDPEAYGLLAVEHLVAAHARELRREVEDPVAEAGVEAVREVGDRRADERHVMRVDHTVRHAVRTAEILEPEVTDLLRTAPRELRELRLVLEHAIDLEAEERADRLTDDRLGDEAGLVAEAAAEDLRAALCEREHLVVDGRAVHTDLVSPVVAIQAPGEARLESRVLHLGGVHERLTLGADEARDRHVDQDVVGGAAVVVERSAQPALEEGEVRTDVELCGTLPLHFGV